MKAPNPIRPTDDDARRLARGLIDAARHGALAVIDPQTGAPSVTRVAIGTDLDGGPLTLVSTLSSHTGALQTHPRCSLLLGEPGAKGDPLTYPRITLDCHARFVERAAPDHDALRARYLSTHPKAKLYVDFGDFRFVTFEVLEARLNGGFGKAYRLRPGDLLPPAAS